MQLRMIDAIRRELGVDYQEEWRAKQNNYIYRVTPQEIQKYCPYNEDGWWIQITDEEYVDILRGEIEPNRKPQESEKYYLPNIYSKSMYATRVWADSDIDHELWDKRLICHTEEEAVAKTTEILTYIRTEW